MIYFSNACISGCAGGTYLIEFCLLFLTHVERRFRFTVAYLVLLLKAGLRSPHRLLDLFVYACTGHTPSDGIHSILLSGGEKSELASIFVDEPLVDDSILDSLTLSSVSGIDFTKLREKGMAFAIRYVYVFPNSHLQPTTRSSS